MVFSQEQSGGICQLWGQWYQATQVQFFMQIPLPLSHGQSRWLRSVRFLLSLQQLGHHQWLWHGSCCHSSCHWSFLLQSLGAGCAVPHHYNACPQLCICILQCEPLRQRPIFNSQGLGHHINSTPKVSLLCLHRYNTWRKGIYGFCILSDDHFTVPTWAGHSHSWLSSTVDVGLHTDRRWATQAFANGITRTSISISFITFTTLLIVGVPRIIGTHATKFNKSGTTRAIWSSL